jgi:multidrug resistance efflux pump
VRESDLAAREAELLKLQAGLATQQESIRRRERALDDAERLQERERAVPAAPYVSFSDGLDAFTGGRPRSG